MLASRSERDEENENEKKIAKLDINRDINARDELCVVKCLGV
jgi:hypothetical protein